MRSFADGIITKVPVSSGQQVKQGDVLIQLDDEEIKLELAAAEIRLAGAVAECERLRAQSSQGICPVSDVVKAEQAAKLAEIELRRCQLRLDRTRIKSPADGTVDYMTSDVEIGNRVAAGDLLVSVRTAKPAAER